MVDLEQSMKQPCQGCEHARCGGCTIPEDALDWRGEPDVGKPEVCRYFEKKAA